MPGNGGGSFPTATNFSIARGSGAFGIIAADFNGDGKRDVATANRGTFNILVLLGNGAAVVIYATGTHPLLPFALSVLHSRNRGMSYTHLVYHIVFGTKDRAALIGAAWEHDLYRSLAATVGNHKGELIEINGTPDHVHMLVRLLPATAVADFLRELKSVSSKWIRRNHEPRFTWQRRYGAFSVSESDTVAVRDYIRDQKRHHTRRSFDAEYKAILQRHSIEFDERYLWD